MGLWRISQGISSISNSITGYGLFDNMIGANSPIGMKRGINALWTHGGLQYAPHVR